MSKGISMSWETVIIIILVAIFLLVAILIFSGLSGGVIKSISLLNVTSFIDSIFKK